jgi:hypothetical protein
MTLICIYLVANETEHLSCAHWLFVYLWRNVCSDPLSIFKLDVFLLLSSKRIVWGFVFVIMLLYYVVVLGCELRALHLLGRCGKRIMRSL